MRRAFLRQRLGQAFDRELRRRIIAGARKTDEAANRRDVDDRARLLGAHDRQHGARHGGEAEEIGVEHRAHVGVVAFFDSREIAVAGVVDEDVDAAEPSFGRLDRSVDLILLVDVERKRKAVLGVARDNVVDLGLVARRHDDTVAALEENDGELPTESGRAAGDEPNGFGMGVRHGGLAKLEVGKARASHGAPAAQRLPY